MKKSVLLLFVIFISYTSSAQLRSILIDPFGEFVVNINISKNEYITISPYGEIVEIFTDNPINYGIDVDICEQRKIRDVGNLAFSYYPNVQSYAGKIKRIGSLNFSYYSDFHSYEAGKLKSIGIVAFEYYSDFHDYNSGKIKRIGSIHFEYHSDFNNWDSGKIKRIGKNTYSYDQTYYNRKNPGGLKSGERHFDIDSIRIDLMREHLRYEL